jgi:hypothetical protein
MELKGLMRPNQNLWLLICLREHMSPILPTHFIRREFDTETYRYIQTVNHCEAQYEDGTVFTFSSIEETMKWLR